ncbi:hypothetical protein QZM46_14670 [Burkholderia vietnamiensis]|uniref:Uncharacterized protein n=2 Tax=Burkholderia cepacia complex TaxID=87882 RepID=A0AAW7T3S8_BURVI|nr:MULTISPECIES: hypothetical protein [Burkholderia cepacia complex]AOJ74317.1 hypothetical protein WJ35_03975 [Burkholderia ubonensis]AOK10110.1 hypothetical protein WK31_07570 [Burkholderia vietnamiensis]KKI36671.1 hypothetical protein VI03_22450 [Burkholderia vietnamiensis]KVE68530.1 hypothetical protein WI96_05515 [Burkholderia vietnamiensis]KVF09680.1 hypothetical protein WJ05_17825 [Burkholderia vietnamiensis]
MVRFLYAAYLAFALYLLYPMVQNTLAFSAGCIVGALPGGARDVPKPSASDAHPGQCVATAQSGGRSSAEIH